MDGILIIDKPENFTSHDVVAKVRRILKTKRIGHTGTLDPFATGVLVILVGQATRLAQFLDKAEKEYLATIQFGYATDTGDHTGLRIADCGLRIEEIAQLLSPENLEKALQNFRGEIWQTPPMYSAKKVDGKKLYELARKGQTVERQPVKVNISTLELIENSEEIRNPQSAFRIQTVCSAGTYIRTLAEDIGKKIGIGAHLTSLRRTRAGSFSINQAITLNELEKLTETGQIEKKIVSPSEALAHFPKLILSNEEVKRVANGMTVFVNQRTCENWDDEQFVRLCDERANLVSVGVYRKSERSLRPKIVLLK